MKWTTLSSLSLACVLAVALASEAAAQSINLNSDTRNVRTMRADTSGIYTFHEPLRGQGQVFGDWLWTTANRGGAVSAQGSSVHFDPSRTNWFVIGARLESKAYLTSINASDPETHYADTFLDMTISTNVPLRYEAVVRVSSDGRNGGYFRGVNVNETSPGVFRGTGTLSPGQHRITSWNWASTNLVDVHSLSDLRASTLVEGGAREMDIWLMGHVAPSPAAVGPGLALLGMVMLRRRPHRAARLAA